MLYWRRPDRKEKFKGNVESMWMERETGKLVKIGYKNLYVNGEAREWEEKN